jgi:hypothetical protein
VHRLVDGDGIRIQAFIGEHGFDALRAAGDVRAHQVDVRGHAPGAVVRPP